MATKLSSLYNLLAQETAQLNLELTKEQLTTLLNFILQLDKWRKTYNLIGPCTLETIAIKHILDSLAITPFIQGPLILDFGSGAGFPGIPLAIALPNYHFTLLDSKLKKTTFLMHVALALNLTNISVAQERIEFFHPSYGFNTIVTRATTTIANAIEHTQKLAAPNGQLLAMQGKKIKSDDVVIPNMQIHQLQVPRLHAERYLACIKYGANS